MAETQQVIIEFLTNTEQVDTAINKLEKTGAIDSKLANSFKQTTSEISKQAAEIQKTAAATTPLKKNLEDVARAVKTTTSAFVTGFHEGVEGALKDAGLSISELKQKLGLFNKDSPFDKLSNKLSETRDKVLNISAAMSQLERTGGVDTEQFDRLGKLLVERQAELEKLQAEYDKVTASVDRNSKETEENTEKIDANAQAQEDLKKKLDSLKQKLDSTAKDSPFDKLSKSVNEARSKVLNITAAMAQLKKTGGVDTEQFKKLQTSLVQAKTDLNNLQTEYDEVTSAAEKQKKATDDNADAQQTLKSRLAEVRTQMEFLKLAGEDNTEQYKLLEAESGRLKDAIGDVAQETKNAAANSQALDGLIGAAQGIAAGFAVAQGAAALFGDDSEELQEVLVRVNASMAILQGLQQLSALTQKESAVAQLFSNRQKIIGNAQLAVENGLQSTSIVVRLGAAAAQRILNAAMAANPILLFISALILVVTAMAAYIKSSKEAEIQTGDLNAAVEAATEGFENYALQIKQQSEKATSELEKNGALQSKILESQLTAEQDINNKRSQEIARLRKFLTTSRDADEAAIKAANDRLAQLTKDRNEEDVKQVIAKNNIDKQLREESIKSQIATAETALLAAKEGSQKQLQLQKQLVSLRAQEELNAAGLTEEEKINIAAKGNQERLELDAAFNKRRIDLQLQGIEAQLVNVREGSQKELDLRKIQSKLQAASEVTNTKLSEKEKQAVIEKGFQDRLKLQREYNERVRRESIEAQISLNEAQISQIKTNDDDRLILQIANIELAAAAEVDAAKGNSAKIKEINAKRDADILVVKKKFIDDAAQYEIDIRTADNGPSNRALQRIIADERKGLNARRSAIRQLADFQISNIDIQLAALEEEKNKRLISDKDYILKYKQLQDQKKQINEDSEKSITDLNKLENQKRLQALFDVLNQIGDVVAGINDNQTERENQRIEAQRDRISQELEAGAITEKEAKARNKRLDIEEKKLRRDQAVRDKNLAIFNAIINTAQAVTKALTAGPILGPILAGITAALGLAQIAIINNRPLPRFGHGKKSGYEGPAEIGETGAELYEQNGRMYIADKKQIVWLGAKDKVYNPVETKEMLMPTVDKQIMQWQAPVQKSETIDYDKLGKAVGKHINIPGFNIDEEGFKIWEQQGQSRKNYMDKRYSSK